MSNKTVVEPKQIVLLFQGGGALGAYQAGVYEALDRNGRQTDWVVGTSIGAINAALIAGNRPERRLEHLYEFWARIGKDWSAGAFDSLVEETSATAILNRWNALAATAFGVPAFFQPRWGSPFGFGMPVDAGCASFYDTSALRETLLELIDFGYLAQSPVRLSVGAVNVETSQIRYFDSRCDTIRVEHILASGALPPAFAPVEIDGQRYWDGGIHSNTPLEWVLRDNPRRHSLCFLATLWPAQDEAPATLADVLRRTKEVQYASRVETLVRLEQTLHRLRHDISLLARRLPETERKDPELEAIIEDGCRSVYHLVRLQAPRLIAEDHTKDIDFAPSRILQRWTAGSLDTLRALAAQPWLTPVGPEEGVVLHDFTALQAVSSEIGSAGSEPAARSTA